MTNSSINTFFVTNSALMSITGSKVIANDVHRFFDLIRVVDGSLNATVKITGATIEVFGIHSKREFYAVFTVGGQACYDSYNLFYFGDIRKVTDKTVTMTTDEGKGKRLTWEKFVRLNCRSLEEMKARNGETMQTI